MEATIVDLRYKMKDVLKALERNETVLIKYRGKVKGIISSKAEKENTFIEDHPFFGMKRKEILSVEEEMQSIRGNRF